MAGSRLRYAVVLLAFIAGFADAATFVGADGIFCAHVTGNFVVIAADLARGARADESLKLSTFPIFVTAVLAASKLHGPPESPGSLRAARRLLAVVSVLLATAAAIAFVHPPTEAGITKSAVVAILVTAMGVQNATHRLSPSLGPMTTVMTGNVTQWLVEMVVPVSTEKAQGHRVLGVLIAAFALGCVSGGVGVAHYGFVVLVVPMAIAVFTRFLL